MPVPDAYAPPGGVPHDHPGLTARVLAALAWARSHPDAHEITDADGPHLHHWQVIYRLWWCRGCGATEDDEEPW